MSRAGDFRLDWRTEFQKLSPFLKGKGGVVVLEYGSDKAAWAKFNYFLKEDAAADRNGSTISLRIDHEWATTRLVHGVLEELDRLLSSVGVVAALPPEMQPSLSIMTDIEAGGDVNPTINGLTINFASGPAGRALRARAQAIFEAVQRFSNDGGRLMVQLNDMELAVQGDFWTQIWHAGLSQAAGAGGLLVVHAGPRANRHRHHDCPAPDLRLVLPECVEEDSERENHFWDDLIDAFEKEGIDGAHAAASVHLSNFRTSVLDLNANLGAAILSAKVGMARRKK
ncbi:MAG TPA: hypothetical protein PKD10_10040 [Paracoccaceae bacterium]|nr:hypothetical protein [Paracoccaceae bacterium]